MDHHHRKDQNDDDENLHSHHKAEIRKEYLQLVRKEDQKNKSNARIESEEAYLYLPTLNIEIRPKPLPHSKEAGDTRSQQRQQKNPDQKMKQKNNPFNEITETEEPLVEPLKHLPITSFSPSMGDIGTIPHRAMTTTNQKAKQNWLRPPPMVVWNKRSVLESLIIEKKDDISPALTKKEVAFVNDLSNDFDMRAVKLYQHDAFHYSRNALRTGSNLWRKVKKHIKTPRFKTMRMFLDLFETNRNPFMSSVNLKSYLQDRVYNYWLKSKRTFDVYYPEGIFRLLWDALYMIFFMIQLFLIPLVICFNIRDLTQLYQVLMAAEFFLIADMLVCMNTGFYQGGNLIMERKAVFLNYFTGKFWIDLISSLPFLVALEVMGSRSEKHDFLFIAQMHWFDIVFLLQLTHLLKIYKLIPVLRKLEDHLQLDDFKAGLLQLTKMISIGFFIAHICACIFYFLGNFSYLKHETSWISDYGMINNYWTDFYVTSLYWAVTTMITVGYGDVTPQNNVERIFSLLVMFVACGVFGFTMNSMGTVLDRFDRSKKYYNTRIESINRYMSLNSIKGDLQLKVRRYLEFVWNLETTDRAEESPLLKVLSRSLKDEVIQAKNLKILKMCRLISSNFSKPFVSKLCFALKEKNYTPEEVIINESVPRERTLYIIHSGEVEIYVHEIGIILQHLAKGDVCGELDFFTNEGHCASARSSFFSTLFVLKWEDFLGCLTNFPVDKEKYRAISDIITLYKEYKALRMKCYICGVVGHFAKYCNNIHFIPNLQKIIHKMQQSLHDIRSNFTRLSRKRFHPLAQFKHVQSYSKVELWEAKQVAASTGKHVTTEKILGLNEVLQKKTTGLSRFYLTNTQKFFGGNLNVVADSKRKVDPTKSQRSLSDGSGKYRHRGAPNVKEPMRTPSDQREKENSPILSDTIPSDAEGSADEEIDLNEEFESVRNYELYFPHNNISSIVNKLRKKKQSPPENTGHIRRGYTFSLNPDKVMYSTPKKSKIGINLHLPSSDLDASSRKYLGQYIEEDDVNIAFHDFEIARDVDIVDDGNNNGAEKYVISLNFLNQNKFNVGLTSKSRETLYEKIHSTTKNGHDQ